MLLYGVSGFFFFKQKTAYEMRISDWSSDVCSSDLVAQLVRAARISVGGGGRGSRHGDEADAHQHEDHQQKHAVDRPEPAAQLRPVGPSQAGEIGRASCRERVCQYV